MTGVVDSSSHLIALHKSLVLQRTKLGVGSGTASSVRGLKKSLAKFRAEGRAKKK